MSGIADTRWTGYFVTLIRGPRVAFLAGPFPHRLAAVDAKAACRALALEIDPMAHFDLIGDARSIHAKPGILNDRLPPEIAATLGPYSHEPHPVRIRTRAPKPEPIE